MRTLPFLPLTDGNTGLDVSAEMMLRDDVVLATAGAVNRADNKTADDKTISFIRLLLCDFPPVALAMFRSF